MFKSFLDKTRIARRLIMSILSSFILALALLVYLNNSLGWFSMNQKVRVNDTSIKTKQIGFDATFTYYKYDVNNETVIKYNTPSDIIFNQYDLIFKSRNRYTPIIIRIALSGDSLPSSGTANVRIYRDLAYPVTETISGETQLSRYSSSIMRFTPYIGTSYYSSDSYQQFYKIDTEQNFAAVRQLVGNINNLGSKVFTTAIIGQNNVLTASKTDYVEIEFSYTSADFINDVLYLYVYITYDEGFNGTTNDGLVGIFQRFDKTTSIGEQAITLQNDLSYLIVSVR